jgi:2-polyprenyl-6-methoxyphenol hydroxylase-like FAD-dependent oxidoreductase
MIIGAGTGGLGLAQGLRGAGLRVRVFERDRTPLDRLQGYRLHISEMGNRALRACLPPENFDRFVASSALPNTAVTFFDHRLSRLLRIAIPSTDQRGNEAERPISRVALRQVLLDGVEDAVSFNKTFVSFDQKPDGHVIARFADGSSAAGDILIGADGAGSRVRQQLLPEAKRVDTGIIAVSGRLALGDCVRKDAPPAIFEGPTLILGPRGCFMFASAVEYPRNNKHEAGGDEYVMWGFSAHREILPVNSLTMRRTRS